MRRRTTGGDGTTDDDDDDKIGQNDNDMVWVTRMRERMTLFFVIHTTGKRSRRNIVMKSNL